MNDSEMNNDAMINVLNNILKIELGGVACYTYYLLMVFGYSRIPIASWMRGQAWKH